MQEKITKTLEAKWSIELERQSHSDVPGKPHGEPEPWCPI